MLVCVLSIFAAFFSFVLLLRLTSVAVILYYIVLVVDFKCFVVARFRHSVCICMTFFLSSYMYIVIFASFVKKICRFNCNFNIENCIFVFPFAFSSLVSCCLLKQNKTKPNKIK